MAPRTWVLLGPKAGDNNQMLALADALPWPCETRTLAFHRSELLANLLLRVTLAGVNAAHSSPLLPPWPDLVISAGRRQEPVARWIQRQSGGHTRLVHVGRPWTPPRRFDLVIATPQYPLDATGSLLVTDLPLHRITAERLRAAAAAWARRLSHLPRPYLTVLVGGNSGHFRLTPARADALATCVQAQLRIRGGSALIVTSARTPAFVAAHLDARIEAPRAIFDWHGRRQDENPYLGYVALADALIVTGDSASMLAEATVNERPLTIFDLERPPYSVADYLSWKPLTHRLVQHLLPRRFQRDIRRLHARLVAAGRARMDTDDAPQVSNGAAMSVATARGQHNDAEAVAARVVTLMGGGGRSHGDN